MDRRDFLMAAPGAFLAGCASTPAMDGPPAAEPVFHVGDRWTYNCSDGFRLPLTWTETHEVTAIDASGITVKVTGVGGKSFSRTELLSSPGVVLVGAVFDNSETRRFETPLIRYQFPLTPGASWDQYVRNFNDLTQRNDIVNRRVTVRGYEQISTPAGTFNAIALSIIMLVNFDDPFRFPTRCTYSVWWAEAAGAMVRETKFATYRERGDNDVMTGDIRAQNAVIELASFTRRPA
jgi:hypothetical protein